MSTEALIANQLLMAQAIFAMAEHIAASTGFQLTPVAVSDLPPEPKFGMLACVNDAAAGAPGSVVAGGGTNIALVFYNGNWVLK